MNVGELSEVRELPDEIDDVFAIYTRTMDECKNIDPRSPIIEFVFQAAMNVYYQAKGLAPSKPKIATHLL